MRGLYYTSPRRSEHKPCLAVMRTKRAEASELTFALAGLAGTGLAMEEVSHRSVAARAQRQSLLADHNPTHCAWVRSDVFSNIF